MGEFKLSVPVLNPDFPVIVEQGLQVLVAVQGGARQPQVVGPQSANVPGRVVKFRLD